MPHDDRLPFHRNNLPKEAGRRLRKARTALGQTRREVAAAAALAPRTLARIERGQQVPSWETVQRLCRALDIDPYGIAPRWSVDSDDVPTDPETVPGLGLRALRRQRGVTLKALAVASGVSISTFSRFERGLLVSRLLARRLGQAPIRYSERDVVLDNDAVAVALGCSDSAELRRECLRAASEL